ncbi:MAG TPA: Tat pathway signal protein [Halococcus sp.]|nr:Tat pathway signal protein [Halococcus sp.]
MPPRTERGLSRRAFVKAAVAIGGSAALSACVARESAPDLPQGPSDLSTLPTRQHAWNEFLARGDHGNHLPPRHRVLLYLRYTGETPNENDRRTVEKALRNVERAYPHSHDGLLVTISYSPAYFERFDASLPESVDLQKPKALTPFEDPKLDTPDTVIHLASDYGQVVLGAEEALMGKKGELNGVKIDANLDGIFERIDRRTGFVGDGLPAENQDISGIPDSEPVPEDAPLYMGFKSGFDKDQATENDVTIGTGPFSGGTTQQISTIKLHLDQWYEQDSRYQRVAKMFCPAHAASGRVEGDGDNLGQSSGMDQCPPAKQSARQSGVVGHSQKTARARKNDRPIILRRDFDSTDGDEATLHFLSLQQKIGDFTKTRDAMNGTDLAANSALGTKNNNGILQYMTVTRRGNYFLPPRKLRALPPANPT